MKTRVLQKEYCIRNRIYPATVTDTKIVLVSPTEVNDITKKRLERFYGSDIAVCWDILPEDSFETGLSRYLGKNHTAKELPKSDTRKETSESLETLAAAAPIVNLLNSILQEAITLKASDIHLNLTPNGGRVRCRVDGSLHEMLAVSREESLALISRIKLLSSLNILEHHRAMDGRFSWSRKNKEFDIRVSILPGSEGESCVLRLLGGYEITGNYRELGFSELQIKQLESIEQLPHGLVLVTGATGSGKTTTLATMLSHLNTADRNVITVEDPVEYRIPGVVQISTDDNRGQTFAELMKRILRHDPDILMAGEIRDFETAELAVRMALTGHLVLSTLHTNSIKETPLRLRDMGIPQYLIDSVLRAVISQQLIKKNDGTGRTLKAEIAIMGDIQ